MTLDVVNSQNEKVGAVDLNDAVFGGTIKKDLVWESVVRENASEASRHARHQEPRVGQWRRQEAL